MIPCHPSDVPPFDSPDMLVTRLTDSAPDVLQICAWCAGFDRFDPRNRGANHICCAACRAKLDAEAI